MSRAEQYMNLAAEVRAKARAGGQSHSQGGMGTARRDLCAARESATYDPIQDMLNRAQPKKKR